MTYYVLSGTINHTHSLIYVAWWPSHCLGLENASTGLVNIHGYGYGWEHRRSESLCTQFMYNIRTETKSDNSAKRSNAWSETDVFISRSSFISGQQRAELGQQYTSHGKPPYGRLNTDNTRQWVWLSCLMHREMAGQLNSCQYETCVFFTTSLNNYCSYRLH